MNAPTTPDPSGTGKDRSGLYLGLLLLYTVVLLIGTVAQLFDIRWILDLPIY